MEVNIKKAVKMFFSSSSFEMIYFEAIANALDAKADTIDIDIKGTRDKNKLLQLANLTLSIHDNGVGMDAARYDKFSKLFDVEEQSHKGLGRLVYLCYFDKVKVDSIFDNTQSRSFVFSDAFEKRSGSHVETCPSQENGTTFTMTEFSGERLHRNEFIQPLYLKKAILEYFYPRLYKEKTLKHEITINISATIDGVNRIETIQTSDIPDFTEYPMEYAVGLFDSVDMYYSIKEVPANESRIITGIAIDDRNMPLDVIDTENIPADYEMIFLLIVKSHDINLVNESRQALNLSSTDLTNIKVKFREAIADVINSYAPKVVEANKKTREYLNYVYPHLQGYFDTKSIGYASRNDVLKRAQEKFFNDQKEILGAKKLTDEQYQKTLDLSARSLAEYILFRQRIIEKMRDLDSENTEYDLHNLIAPRFSEFSGSNFIEDVYRNNVWVLDDKFMSYSTVLSDKEMGKVISVLTNGNATDDSDKDRPDITLFFSGNPNDESQKVDVVVVELKRLGISAEQNSIVEFQLDTRAERLAEFYDNRIQRMWFYGVVEMDARYRKHLINNEFSPLFSNGNVFFRSKKIWLDEDKTKCVIQNAYIMDFKALVEDANKRNETFLKILRQQFAEQQNQNNE